MSEERPFAIHASMLTTPCQMIIKHRYIDGKKSPPGVAAYVGTAVHRAAELDLARKIESGQLASAEEVRQRAVDAIDSAWAEEPPLLSDEEREAGEVRVKGAAKDKTVRLSDLHHDQVSPIIQPEAVELRLRVEDPNFKYAVEGTIDVLDKRRILRDRKTSAKSPSADEADGNVQLDVYTMLLDQHGKPVDTLALDYLVDTKVPKYVAVVAEATRDHTSTLARIGAFARLLDSGAFQPVNPSGPSGWICQPRWCGFYDTCEFGRRARRQVQVPKSQE